MHLIVVHGVPGVGKRTVCTELAKLTGYRFFNSHHLAVLIGPVFGYSTPAFNDLRDRIYDGILDAAADEGLVGLMSTLIFEPSVKLERFERQVARAAERGAAVLFAGLTCSPDEQRRRMTPSDRAPLGKWTDFESLQATMATGYFDFPKQLPGHSLVVDTTSMTASETAHHIHDRLPPAMRA